MSEVLVYCPDCDKEVKEKDCIHDSEEGYICFGCIKKRREYIKNMKRPKITRWMK